MELLVLSNQDYPHGPRAKSATKGECSHSCHGQRVSWAVLVPEEVRRVDEGSVGDGRHHGDGDGFLFLSLIADRSGPA